MLLDHAPYWLFFIAAALATALRGKFLCALILITPLVSAWLMFSLGQGDAATFSLFGQSLTLIRVDRLSLLFGILFHIAALLFVLFSLHLRDPLQHVFALLHVGSALGAVFAGDLLTLFIFWELVALSSVGLIWASRTSAALAAGIRYLFVQVLSGILLLAGAILQIQKTGSASFEMMGLSGIETWLIFCAFGIKCGFPPFHNQLTDAYPNSTPTGAVYLSGFSTFLGIYALARGFPGTELLIYVGALMTFFPIFYAVIENDLRRVLAYSSTNQLGFMVCGIGIGSALAINGAVAHAFNNVLFKGLLMMSMGAVLMRTGTAKATELGGLYRQMPVTTVFCIVGAAAISAFPLFSGFVSKALIMSAALAENYVFVWIVLLFASAGVFHHAGIKIPFFAFFAEDAGIKTREPPPNMLIAMGLAAALCILIGVYPDTLYRLLPFAVDYSPYHWNHVISQMQLLCFSALAFIWLRRQGIYPPELRSVNIDVEWIYRRFMPRIWERLIVWLSGQWDFARDAIVTHSENAAKWLTERYLPSGPLAQTWQTGTLVLIVTGILGVILIFNYIYY